MISPDTGRVSIREHSRHGVVPDSKMISQRLLCVEGGRAVRQLADYIIDQKKVSPYCSTMRLAENWLDQQIYIQSIHIDLLVYFRMLLKSERYFEELESRVIQRQKERMKRNE